MIYITGDTHRDFKKLNNIEKNEDNMLIILGDVSLNYCLDDTDKKYKEMLNNYNIKLFCIQGNHEERPENISTYKEKEMFGGKVFVEEAYPNLIFAKNGELYNIDNKKVLVIGGACSIDKDYRIMHGLKWFKNEQLSYEEMNNILEKYSNQHVDIILSHTCPVKYEPTEVFIKGIDQSKVDKTMEKFLQEVEEKVDYDKWYCGHYHTEKKIDKIEFMFGRIKKFSSDEYIPKYDNNGFEIIRDAYSQREVPINDVKCPKCKSFNSSILYDDQDIIAGANHIGIVCNDCKKLYGFHDVIYKKGYPRKI